MSRRGILPLRAMPQRRLSAVVLILFLLAQTAALLHAETHAFHEQSELCTVFHSVEHQPALGGAGVVAVIEPAIAADQPLPSLPQQPQRALRAFQARGPPLFISQQHV